MGSGFLFNSLANNNKIAIMHALTQEACIPMKKRKQIRNKIVSISFRNLLNFNWFSIRFKNVTPIATCAPDIASIWDKFVAEKLCFIP